MKYTSGFHTKINKYIINLSLFIIKKGIVQFKPDLWQYLLRIINKITFLLPVSESTQSRPFGFFIRNNLYHGNKLNESYEFMV